MDQVAMFGTIVEYHGILMIFFGGLHRQGTWLREDPFRSVKGRCHSALAGFVLSRGHFDNCLALRGSLLLDQLTLLLHRGVPAPL